MMEENAVILRQLQTFVRVYETGSMVQSAKQLFISQPAVSQQIKKLENDLDAELFEHRKGRLTPTEYGRAFYPYDKRALSELETGQEVLRRKLADKRLLRIHVFFYNAESAMTRLVSTFCKQHPNTPIRLQKSEPPKRFHTAAFEENALYFADEQWTQGTGLHFYKLYDARLLCIMRQDCPLAGRQSLQPEDLAQETVYLPHTPNATLRPVFDRLAEQLPRERQRLSDGFSDSIINISTFGGVCIAPDYLFNASVLTAVPFLADFRFPVGFAYAGSLTGPMKRFLLAAREHFASDQGF